MKRLSIISVVLFIGGCGSIFDPSPGRRLEVADTLRQACPGLADFQISNRIFDVADFFERGHSYVGQVEFWPGSRVQCDREKLLCPTDVRRCATCHDCWVAVIDQVYGVR